jgi:hypothetical protein
MYSDGKNRAYGKKGGDEICPPVTEKRQRHTLCRKRLAHNSDIEHRLEKDDERHSKNKESPESITCIFSDID